MRDLKISILLQILIFFLINGCSSEFTPKTDDLNKLIITLMEGSRNNNINRLVEIAFTDSLEGVDIQRKVAEANDLVYVPFERPFTNEELKEAVKININIFLESYRDLFNYPTVMVTTARTIKGIQQISAIIWVDVGNEYHGIYIESILNTKNGLKIGSWFGADNGSFAYQYGELYKKKAILVAKTIKDCKYPVDGIEFEYAYK